MFHMDGEVDGASRSGCKVVFHHAERTGDEREKIGGLWMRVVPDGKMPFRLALHHAAFDRIAV